MREDWQSATRKTDADMELLYALECNRDIYIYSSRCMLFFISVLLLLTASIPTVEFENCMVAVCGRAYITTPFVSFVASEN